MKSPQPQCGVSPQSCTSPLCDSPQHCQVLPPLTLPPHTTTIAPRRRSHPPMHPHPGPPPNPTRSPLRKTLQLHDLFFFSFEQRDMRGFNAIIPC